MATNVSQHSSDPSGGHASSPLGAHGVLDGVVISDTTMAFREALVSWLRWNEAYERVSTAMYDSQNDPRQLESLMDQMDRLRRRAIKLSHELLD